MKHLLLPIIQNMMDINVELHQWLITFFDRNSTSTSTHTGTGTYCEIQQLAEELNEKIIKRFQKNIKNALLLKATFGVPI